MIATDRSAKLLIRLVQESDHVELLRLRRALWPDDSLAEHIDEMSPLAHARLGYQETSRRFHYRKDLT